MHVPPCIRDQSIECPLALHRLLRQLDLQGGMARKTYQPYPSDSAICVHAHIAYTSKLPIWHLFSGPMLGPLECTPLPASRVVLIFPRRRMRIGIGNVLEERQELNDVDGDISPRCHHGVCPLWKLQREVE